MLTEAQKRRLANCSVEIIINYIDSGHVTYPDDLIYLCDDKKQAIRDNMNQRPNPTEQAEWKAIEPYLGQVDDSLCTQLQAYISHWDSIRPVGNHVDEARNLCSRYEDEVYNNLNLFDIHSILGHLDTYPHTVHLQDLDDAVWQLISKPPISVENINTYLTRFPIGSHRGDANNLQQDFFEWENLRYSEDIFAVFEYISQHPQSLFINDARYLLTQLKNKELEKMRINPEQYQVEYLFVLINKGIFQEKELIQKGVLSPRAIQILRDVATYKRALPDLETVMKRVNKECLPGHTDVFLFGIPSTGKSCVLMGLIGADQRLSINTKVSGGEYAAALGEYLDHGFTPGATRGTFVTTIEGYIPVKDRRHEINLVEMSGEEFAYKLAQNEDAEVSLADMGEGAPELLANDNKKIFFIIVDPTVEYVPFKRLFTRTESYIDEEGNEGQREYEETIDCFVNQKTVLKGMVDLFRLPQNKRIMEKVDGIHIIVTKADTLDHDPVEREQKALARFNQFHKNIVQPLIDVCAEYGINKPYQYKPQLYTFSLGAFYPGGIYEYNDADSNKLIDVIRVSSFGVRKKTFGDRIKEIFN